MPNGINIKAILYREDSYSLIEKLKTDKSTKPKG